MAVDDALSVHPTQAVFTSGLDLATIAAGRVVEARVVSLVDSQAVLTGRFGTLQVDLGAAKAAVGDVLRFEVQAPAGGDVHSGLTLALVGRATDTAAATAATTATPARALAHAVGRAAATQSGLAPLFASLAGLASAPTTTLPAPVRALVDQLMSTRLGADGTATAADVARGFQGSGLFLESRLATAAQVSPSQDLKAGLLALKDALTRWVGTGANPGAPSAASPATTTAPSSATAPTEVPTTATVATTAADGRPVVPTRSAETPTALDLSSRLATAAYGAPRSQPTVPQTGAPATVPTPGATVAVATAVASTVVAATASPATTPAPGSAVPATPGDVALATAATTMPAAIEISPEIGTAAPAAQPGTTTIPSADQTAIALAQDLPSANPTTAPATTPPSGAALEPEGPLAARLPLPPPLAPSAAPLAAASAGGEASIVAASLVDADARGRADRTNRPPPPRRGSIPRGQAALPAETATNGSVEALGRRALERTDGALQRILLEQYAALDHHDDATAPIAAAPRHGEWTAEIPLATRDGTAVMQMTVERDRSGRGGATRDGSGDWRVRFALDVEPIGPVTAQIGLSGERLSVGLWIERPEMAVELGDAIGQLRGALEAAAIPVEAIHVATGRPPEAQKPPASGRFIDVSL